MSDKKSLRTLSAFNQEQLIKAEDIPKLEKVVEHFSVAISSHMQQQIDKNNPLDPIALQFVPDVKELDISENELIDPISDQPFTPVKGIIHRYPDRCLFTPLLVCPVYCRFCFRKEKVGPGSETLTPTEITTAFNYIQQHSEIWEVILTGGEPLMLKPAMLKTFIDRLSAIPHLEIIRIHTRVPVVEPHRITTEMIAALKSDKAIYINLHANHPNEFTQEAVTACKLLVDAGIPMLSQTLLLKGVNDTIEVLSQLMRCFIKNRIKPYYLHHGDLARGTQHLRTTIAKGQELMQQLRGRFSGICQPTYVLDIPGGFGKVPIGPNYITQDFSAGKDQYCVQDYKGCIHRYP